VIGPWRLGRGSGHGGKFIGVLQCRWEMPFSDIASFGLDPQRHVYAFARIAQPAKDV
jgi:hypothetical protein